MQLTKPAVQLKPSQVAALVVAGVMGGLVAWFGWLYPLLPTTALGWLVAIGSGLAVIAWACICVAGLIWLQGQQRNLLLFRIIGVVVALSLGIGVFAGAYAAQEFLSVNFSYFGH